MSSGGGNHSGPLKLPLLHEIEAFLEGANEERGIFFHGWALMGSFALLNLLFFLFFPVQSFQNFELLLFLSPTWIPLLLARFSFLAFILMRRVAYSTPSSPARSTVLLEVRLPRDTMKSPAAMEAVFSSIHLGPGEGTWYKKFWLGRTRPWYSFELASFGGEIHFYIWTRKAFRRAIESYMYAQYPGVEIIEAEDYSRLVDPSQSPFKMFACEYKSSKPDPYPIKTYVEYGLDSPTLKLEQQVDPLAQVLELLGSIGPHEQVWIQMIVRYTKYEKFYHLGKGRKHGWKEEAKEIVEGIRQEIARVNPETGETSFPNPTKEQTERMSAIARNVGKLGFDIGIRSIYFAPPDKYYGSMNAMVTQIFRAFNSEIYNSLNPAQIWSEKFNDYPWEDIGGRRQAREMHEALEMFRRRAYYHPPYAGPWMIMSTEELATLWHIPSRTVSAPTLTRLQSATGGAPANLPT